MRGIKVLILFSFVFRALQSGLGKRPDVYLMPNLSLPRVLELLFKNFGSMSLRANESNSNALVMFL